MYMEELVSPASHSWKWNLCTWKS